MNGKWFLGVFLSTLLIILLFVGIDAYLKTSEPTRMDIFVGVDAAYDVVDDIESSIDEIKSYTNFLVIGSTGITGNVTRLNEVCQYAYDNGLYFSTYIHPLNQTEFNQSQWISGARQKWGSNFWGLYVVDEPGGHQVDRFQLNNETYMLVTEANNYTDAANKYVASLNRILNYFRIDWNVGDFPLITSDYVFYEFNYRAGYDAVFAEFGWNHSRPLNVALCRGAATVRNKDWGVMITYTYDTPPYLEPGPELYNDMVTAYQSGAKYIIVFDYAKDHTKNISYGILQPEHLDALKQFWQYVKDHPRTNDMVDDRVAYVLPKDYGYGFRGPNDKIWGLWEADNLSSKIWNDVNSLLEQYETRLDLIYENDLQTSTFRYEKLIFWNGTTTTE